jgi:hypothetical protein
MAVLPWSTPDRYIVASDVSFDFEYPTRALRERSKYEVIVTTPMICLDVKEHPGAKRLYPLAGLLDLAA